MDVASWFVFSLALTGPPQAPVVAPPPAVIRANFESTHGNGLDLTWYPAAARLPDTLPRQVKSFPGDDQQRPPQGERPLPPEERPHQIGIGAGISATTQGMGGATRFFINDRFGIDFMASWHNPRTRNTTGSVFNVTPSVIYMLKLPNDLASIDIRPYVGAGFSYVRSSYRPVGTVYTGSNSGLGGQVFGGAELTFKDAQFVTISFEGRYYSLPTRGVNVNMIDGFNFLMMFHFYLK